MTIEEKKSVIRWTIKVLNGVLNTVEEADTVENINIDETMSWDEIEKVLVSVYGAELESIINEYKDTIIERG